MVLANATDRALDRVLKQGCWTPVERFGVGGEWQTQALDADAFRVSFKGEERGHVRWDLFGEHSRTNALAAVAAASHAGVNPAAACEALGRFTNVRRRMELRGTAGGVAVYDDFAHHPTAIAATLAGLRQKAGRARVLAVLEPRSNTMKMGVIKDALPDSLAAADLVYCYSANLGWDPAGVLASLGARAVCDDDLDALIAKIATEARPGDQVLVMSNGGFGGIHQKLLDRLNSGAKC
jgi:UDP-N-acetylmuramate: L-alanyl-gamma-D-glutamyl-meso-diaminopimelate ligase